MPRYVILEHDHPHLHWDLMLEDGDVLRTWRLQATPEPAKQVRAEQTFDHRPFYLDYEGPISGGRGHVRRWDAGAFSFLEQGADLITLDVHGERLGGRVALRRDAAETWIFELNQTN